MGWLTGKVRLWESSVPRTWLPLDLGRPRKQTILVLDLGRRVRPALTPDEPDRVAALIRERIDGAVR